MAFSCSVDSNFSAGLDYALRKVGSQYLILKDEQIETMEAVYNGKDVFVLLPTGYGKSICYECLPFLYDYKLGLTSSASEKSMVLVVSPLVSLMINQVQNLRERGVSAAILSGNVGVQKELQVSSITPGQYSLVFTAPEAILESGKWRECLLDTSVSNKIVAVAVDEAHCVSRWSRTFRPVYARVGEIRAIIPSGTPWMASTATATHVVKDDVCKKLDMVGCKLVSVSPDRPNMYYEVCRSTDIEQDFHSLLIELRTNRIKTNRLIVYCRSLNTCSDLYIYFLCNLGKLSYFPDGAEEISDNRLFGMFHSSTPPHNKDVILKSMQREDGVVRVVFATVALGMGINFVGLNRTIHYGAPTAIEDYFQESGRAGRSGVPAKSTIYWKPFDAPLRKDLSNPRDAELVAVRRYLENDSECRRYQLLKYFDPSLVLSRLNIHDPLLCCDVCAANIGDVI